MYAISERGGTMAVIGGSTGPRRYRLHIFDGQYEVLHRRTYQIELDLDGPGVGPMLDRQLMALTAAARSANEPMDEPRLEVRDWATGVKVLDWSGF